MVRCATARAFLFLAATEAFPSGVASSRTVASVAGIKDSPPIAKACMNFFTIVNAMNHVHHIWKFA
jgi:hypothetical protein